MRLEHSSGLESPSDGWLCGPLGSIRLQWTQPSGWWLFAATQALTVIVPFLSLWSLADRGRAVPERTKMTTWALYPVSVGTSSTRHNSLSLGHYQVAAQDMEDKARADRRDTIGHVGMSNRVYTHMWLRYVRCSLHACVYYSHLSV